MPEDKVFRDIVADMLAEEREKRVNEMIRIMGPSPDTEDVPPERERDLWWHRSITPEQEAQLWALPGMTEEKVSREVYKVRWQMYEEEWAGLKNEERAKKANKLGGTVPPPRKVLPSADPQPQTPSLLGETGSLMKPMPTAPMAPLGEADEFDSLY